MVNEWTAFDASPLHQRKWHQINKLDVGADHLDPFSRTLPARRRDEAASLADLLQRQAAALGKSKSQPTLLEQFSQGKLDFAKRARDKLSVELELFLQRKQVLIDIQRLRYSTNKRFLQMSEFVHILKTYKVYDILHSKLMQIQSVLREENGSIDFEMFIDCLKKAQAVPSFMIPKQRPVPPVEPLVSWILPPLPPIYGKHEKEVNRWSEKQWERYYLEEQKNNNDDEEDSDDDKDEAK